MEGFRVRGSERLKQVAYALFAFVAFTVAGCSSPKLITPPPLPVAFADLTCRISFGGDSAVELSGEDLLTAQEVLKDIYEDEGLLGYKDGGQKLEACTFEYRAEASSEPVIALK